MSTSSLKGPNGSPDHEPRSNPNVPTLDALNDVRSAQFAQIRSISVSRGDYGSGGRGFESLPARKLNSAFQHHLGGRISRFQVSV